MDKLIVLLLGVMASAFAYSVQKNPSRTLDLSAKFQYADLLINQKTVVLRSGDEVSVSKSDFLKIARVRLSTGDLEDVRFKFLKGAKPGVLKLILLDSGSRKIAEFGVNQLK